MKFFFLFLLGLSSVYAQKNFGYLEASDQKFFKNDNFEGNNKVERIDANVKEINRLHGEVAALKAQMAALRAEFEQLRNKK